MSTIQLGCSSEHLGFAGTISLRPQTLSHLLLDISRSLLKSGLSKLFIVNGHGGNRAPLDTAMARAKELVPGMRIYAFTIIDIAKERFENVRKSSRRMVGHADEIETSMMLAIEPGVVNLSKAVRETPSIALPLSFETSDLARTSFAWNSREISKSGVIGDPEVSSRETGSLLLDFTINVISKTINQL